MKRRSVLSWGLVGLLSLAQPKQGRSGEVDKPPGEGAESAGPLKRGAAKLREALDPDQWDEKGRQRGLSSWYGKPFHGKTTASGEPFDMHAMTAAHRTLPMHTYVRVTNLANGKEVIVRINDRGPRLHSRVIDLSHAAAQALGFAKKGLARVELEVVAPDEIEQLAGR